MSENKAVSIQKHLEIKEIKDDVIILKNGGIRGIMLTTSINFDLKSIDEQDAIIYQYQNFLNSLDFPIQIIAASRKFDIDPYIESLEQRQNQQENELLRIQTSEYINFIKGLTQMTNIMTESFYVVVPYDPIKIKQGFLDRIFKKNSNKENLELQEFKNNLWQRMEYVATGLQGFGVRAIPLNTEELIELFYKLYNPNAKEEPELQKAKDLRMQ